MPLSLDVRRPVMTNATASLLGLLLMLLSVSLHVVAMITCWRRRRLTAMVALTIGALGVLAGSVGWLGSAETVEVGFTPRSVWMLIVLILALPTAALAAMVVFAVAYGLTKPTSAVLPRDAFSIVTTSTALSLFFDVMFVLSVYTEMH
jgi:hypothetical protein